MFHCCKNFESLGELSKILDHRLSLKEAAIEMFRESGCTFYDRQFILLNIVLSRRSKVQYAQAVHQRVFRPAKQIKSTQVYGK